MRVAFLAVAFFRRAFLRVAFLAPPAAFFLLRRAAILGSTPYRELEHHVIALPDSSSARIEEPKPCTCTTVLLTPLSESGRRNLKAICLLSIPFRSARATLAADRNITVSPPSRHKLKKNEVMASRIAAAWTFFARIGCSARGARRTRTRESGSRVHVEPFEVKALSGWRRSALSACACDVHA